jgi:Fe-S-cluster-containing hydrogenase component 2
MSLQFVVRQDRCNRCGECVTDCPAGIIGMIDDGLPVIQAEKETLCYRCQHCLTVCPTAAVSILGHDPDKSLLLSPDALPTLDQTETYVRGRRSVRQYERENVDAVLLSRLLAAMCNVPTGVNAQDLTFTVIDDRASMEALREKMVAGILAAANDGRVPERASYLQRIAASGGAVLTRGAPHMLLASAPPEAPCAQEDVVLALGYFELLAQSAGLGTVWWGMLKMTLETLPELKPLLGLDPTHKYYAMLFGIPAVHYARAAQRDDGAVVKRLVV